MALAVRVEPDGGAIEGVRWSLFGTPPPFADPGFFVSLALTAAILAGGVWYFRRTERTFADVI